MLVYCDAAGAKNAAGLFGMSSTEELRNRVLLFFLYRVTDKFREIQKVIAKRHRDVLCVDLMPSIDRQFVYGKTSPSESHAAVQEFCNSFGSVESQEKLLNEATRKHLEMDVLFFSQVHSKNAHRVLELLKLELVADQCLEDLTCELNGKAVKSGAAEGSSRPVLHPFVDARNKRMDFSHGPGLNGLNGPEAQGEVLLGIEKAAKTLPASQDKKELCSLIRDANGTTFEDVAETVTKDEQRMHERWKSTLLRKVKYWNAKGSRAWVRDHGIWLQILHVRVRDFILALLAAPEGVGSQTTLWGHVRACLMAVSHMRGPICDIHDRHLTVRHSLLRPSSRKLLYF